LNETYLTVIANKFYLQKDAGTYSQKETSALLQWKEDFILNDYWYFLVKSLKEI